MDWFNALRILHILGATVLFGTGLGIAYFMLMAYRSGDVAVMAATFRHVVLADFLFTATAVVLQPATGIGLAMMAGYDLTAPWLVATYALYALTGLCWLPVVWLQARLRAMAVEAARTGAPPPPRFHRYMRIWFALGWPAFLSVTAIFVLMTLKPS